MNEPLELPQNLAGSRGVERDPALRAWVDRLPATVADVAARWSLQLGRPFQPGGQTAWVAPARRADGLDLVVKVGFPHPEAEHEADGLRLWAGRGAVLVHRDEKSVDAYSLLLERASSGQMLAQQPEEEQDEVVAGLLRRLWVEPPRGHPFRGLGEMCARWADEYEAAPPPELDAGVARAGVELFRSLPDTATEQVLLATDLHAENVLAAAREPWLVIDPKPYVGDPAYDPLQHMFNCRDRLVADPGGLADRVADLCDLDRHRLRQWLFARAVVESSWWPGMAQVAAALAP